MLASEITDEIRRRFEARVDRTPNPSGCWLWTGMRSRKGYGMLNVARKHIGAHRVAVLMSGRDLPPGMCACHHCDNPPCVNPAHLFVGTNADNQGDRRLKQRWRRKFCAKGHPMIEGNLRIQYPSWRCEKRECKTCYNERTKLIMRERRALKKAS